HAVVGVHEAQEALAERLVDREARDVRPGGVEELPHAARVRLEDDLLDVVDDRAVLLLAAAQRLLGAHLRAVVDERVGRHAILFARAFTSAASASGESGSAGAG